VRVASALHPLKYQGYFNWVNSVPQNGWIEVFCSDWNKDHWAFYAYIGADSHREDLKAINRLIMDLNFRDGDVYVELIDHSRNLSDFYHTLYSDLGSDYVLKPDIWEKNLPLLEENYMDNETEKVVSGTFCGYWEDGHSQLIILMDDNMDTKDYRILPSIVIGQEHKDPMDHLVAKNGQVARYKIHDYGSFFTNREQEIAFFATFWQKWVTIILNDLDKVISIKCAR